MLRQAEVIDGVWWNWNMARPLRFHDAAKLLADGDDKLLKALDHLLSGVLLLGGLPGLFDPKNAVIQMLGDLRRGSGKVFRSTAKGSRGEVMIAAHTTVVLSAFFDELAGIGVANEVNVGRDDQFRLVGAGAATSVLGVLNTTVPMPAPHVARELYEQELSQWYEGLAKEVDAFLSGFAVVDAMSTTARTTLRQQLITDVPRAALARYVSYVGALAQECVEFGFWLLRWEHAATRAAAAAFAGETRTGLAELERLLAMLHPKGSMDRRWDELGRAYLAELDRPVVQPGEHGAPKDLVIPRLRDSYVNPAFRVTGAGETGQVSEDAWWESNVPVQQDLQKFLVRYLSSPEATEQPLLVLGHPGSGKSVFTRTFAARLRDTGFRPLRVDLRRVPADASIVEQIRCAVRETLQRDVEWAELSDCLDGATPVVFLDGFDELLQASSAGQADYLERIGEFQRLARLRDVPVGVVVTSRTVVAHRARIPAGATVLRLEPFDSDRIASWLDLWNLANRWYFKRVRLFCWEDQLGMIPLV